ncbi:hypothetical protein ACWA1F_23905 [Flavobacterium sp. 3-218]
MEYKISRVQKTPPQQLAVRIKQEHYQKLGSIKKQWKQISEQSSAWQLALMFSQKLFSSTAFAFYYFSIRKSIAAKLFPKLKRISFSVFFLK